MNELLAPLAGAPCVVTGGLGFIGSNLALALAEAGAQVTVVDALVPRHGGNRANVEGADIEVIVADIGDECVRSSLSTADYVFNLAGQVSHSDSMSDPMGDLHWNTISQLRLLEMLRDDNRDARVVYASTRQVYGRLHHLPVAETHPLAPVDVNGVCKLAAEQLHAVYAAAHGMRTCSLRLTNVYGPRMRIDVDHLGVLNVFFRLALAGDPIHVFGDGAQLRDCLYVDDVVDGFLRAALTDTEPGQVFNLGGPPHPLVDVARAIAGAAESGSEVRLREWPEAAAKIDVGSYHGDWTLAQACLGWQPTVSLAEGAARTVAAFRAAS